MPRIAIFFGLSLLLAAPVIPASAQDLGSALTAPVRVPGRELPRASTPEAVGNWMMVGGGALLLGGWGANALGGFGAGVSCSFGLGFGTLGGGGGSGCQHHPEWQSFRDWSYVPVLGPFAQLALLPEDGRGGGWEGWLIASALLQSSGLALLVAGLITRLGAPARDEPKPPRVSVTPALSPGFMGLSVRSAF